MLLYPRCQSYQHKLTVAYRNVITGSTNEHALLNRYHLLCKNVSKPDALFPSLPPYRFVFLTDRTIRVSKKKTFLFSRTIQ